MRLDVDTQGGVVVVDGSLLAFEAKCDTFEPLVVVYALKLVVAKLVSATLVGVIVVQPMDRDHHPSRLPRFPKPSNQKISNIKETKSVA